MSHMLKRMFAECQTPSFSRRFDKSGVAHEDYDTTSILKLLEKRFDLDPLVNRPVRNLAVALQAADSGRR
jgi:hypothetical protein